MLPLQTLAGWLQSWYLMSRCWLQYPFKWRTREWNLMISDGFTFDILVMTSWGGDGKRRGQFTDRSSNISINDANLRGYGFILRNWYYVGAYLGKVKWLGKSGLRVTNNLRNIRRGIRGKQCPVEESNKWFKGNQQPDGRARNGFQG